MPERATVTCFCGQTGLTFANPLPRNHSECLCVDCRQKLEWACGQAGRPWTPTISNLWYIDDDVVATKGEEHLQEFVLRSSGEGTPVVPGTQTEVVSPFVVATCCHSVLCVPAIYYNSNYVAVIEQGCRLQCHDESSDCKAKRRIRLAASIASELIDWANFHDVSNCGNNAA